MPKIAINYSKTQLYKIVCKALQVELNKNIIKKRENNN